MDVIVKGRQTGIAQRFRDHANEKLVKIQKLDSKVMRIDVEVSKEPNPRLSDRRERVELTCRTKGPVIRAEAAAEDRYAALDQALARLKERLRKICDRRKVHHGAHTPRSVAEATREPAGTANPMGAAPPLDTASRGWTAAPTAGSTPAAAVPVEEDSDQAVVPLETRGEAPLVVREKIHRANPMSLDQALLEMELVGHDFFLFRDSESGHPSVVYRRRGFDYGVIRLEE